MPEVICWEYQPAFADRLFELLAKRAKARASRNWHDADRLKQQIKDAVSPYWHSIEDRKGETKMFCRHPDLGETYLIFTVGTL